MPMPLAQPNKLKRDIVSSDLAFQLLQVNAILVIVGYALAVTNDMEPVKPFQWFKIGLLGISILHIASLPTSVLRLIYYSTQGAHGLCILLIGSSFLADNFILSITRTLTFIIPFLYILYVIGYLLLRYDIESVFHAFIRSYFLVYSLPVLFYFFLLGELERTNIYSIAYENPNSWFVSNHYGWASILVFVTVIDMLQNIEINRFTRIFLVLTGLVSLYLMLISGSRSSWLSLLLVICIYLFPRRKTHYMWKILLVCIPLGAAYLLSYDADSAVSRRIEKTKLQLKVGEPRHTTGERMFRYFNKNPILYLKGIGLFNQSTITNVTGSKGYHNSYLEILFGAGISTFALFFYLIVLRPTWIYWYFFSDRYVLLPPLLIIPFFESNLTAGQFYFYPWFTFLLFWSYFPRFTYIKCKIDPELTSRRIKPFD